MTSMIFLMICLWSWSFIFFAFRFTRIPHITHLFTLFFVLQCYMFMISILNSEQRSMSEVLCDF